MNRHRLRRLVLSFITLLGVGFWLIVNPASYEQIFQRQESSHFNQASHTTSNTYADTGAPTSAAAGATNNGITNPDTGITSVNSSSPLASAVLMRLEVKGRAPKTGYSREKFYSGWPTIDGCNLRQRILKREFGESASLDGCTVVSGEFDEPYTGKHLIFTSKTEISKGLQIDHVVALSDAWQKGADTSHMDSATRYQIATDPLNLLAVDGSTNEKKSDADAATWLPPNQKFRCAYVARQVSVKFKYHLWITEAEKTAISRVLEHCPTEPAIGVSL